MVGVVILAIMLTAGPYASAPNCKVMYQGTQDEWRFVRVYEVESRKVVLQTVIRGGTSRDVYVTSPTVRVYSKWAGDIDYKPGPTVQCADGGTIKF